MFGLHHPPCALDELERITLPLGALGLGAGGAVLQEGLQKRLLESPQEAGGGGGCERAGVQGEMGI